jgi:hypothetical protein
MVSYCVALECRWLHAIAGRFTHRGSALVVLLMGLMSGRIQRFQDLRLPNSRTRALPLLALFVSVQVADACLTSFGIARFGMAAEGNPMLALGFVLFGPAASLTFAKGTAVIGAVLLYRFSRHFLIALLTVMYVFVAIMPWAWALTIA